MSLPITGLTGNDTFEEWYNTTNIIINQMNTEMVTGVNGLTGNVSIISGVTTNSTNTFIPYQNFVGGISVSGGITFYNTVNINRGGEVVMGVGNGSVTGLASSSDIASCQAIGRGALKNNSTGVSNIAIGRDALEFNISGSGNVAIGLDSQRGATAGYFNTTVGYDTMRQNLTGNDNVVVGYEGMMNTEAGHENVAIGSGRVLFSSVAQSKNIAIGHACMTNHMTGENNVSIGHSARYDAALGSNNISIGSNSLNINVYDNNVAIGSNAMLYNNIGGNNVVVGSMSGINRGTNSDELTGSTGAVFIGYGIRSYATDGQINEIVIGAGAMGLGTNTTVIGATLCSGTRIYGVHSTGQTGPTIQSNATIAPSKTISFVSGTTIIETITPPSLIATSGGQITLIPTGLWSTNTTGNIALATTAVVSKALIMTYDAQTAKWYPSY